MAAISLDPKTEQDIIEKAKKDKQHFERLYQHYYPHIKRFLTYRTSDPEDAEDLTSIVFEKAYQALDSFQWQGVSFSSWLYRIARNSLIDHYRSQNKNKNDIRIETDMKIESRFQSPEQAAIEFYQQEFLESVLRKLPKRERKTIYLKFYEGRTNKEIAEDLDLSETNVSTIVHRALNKLRETLNRNENTS